MTGPGLDPFTVLGLPARPDLTDEQVRAAWRTIAAATHPDRTGGGNPAAYAAASAAYAALRTAWGRSEAYADLTTRPPPRRAGARPDAPGVNTARALRLVPARIRHGRPLRLVLRILAAVVLALIAAQSGAGGPAVAGVAAGLAMWAVLTGRGDLAPPPGR